MWEPKRHWAEPAYLCVHYYNVPYVRTCACASPAHRTRAALLLRMCRAMRARPGSSATAVVAEPSRCYGSTAWRGLCYTVRYGATVAANGPWAACVRAEVRTLLRHVRSDGRNTQQRQNQGLGRAHAVRARAASDVRHVRPSLPMRATTCQPVRRRVGAALGRCGALVGWCEYCRVAD